MLAVLAHEEAELVLACPAGAYCSVPEGVGSGL